MQHSSDRGQQKKATSAKQTGEALVKVEQITKRFPGVLALDGAGLEIRRAEVHALLGENGAGKSTLIKLLSGVYQPDEGCIIVRGEKVNITDTQRAQALGITTIYQEHTLAPDLSPIENVFLGREIRRPLAGRAGPLLDEAAMGDRARQLWKEFGGNVEDLRRPVNELGGLKQRLIEIIKALAFDTELVIMDEPTAQLPDDETANLLDHIRKMRASGVSVLLVTHRLEELLGLADRVTIFRDGRWVETVPMAETSIDQIIRRMVGREVGSMAVAAARPSDMPLPENTPEVLRVTGLTRPGVLRDVSLTVRSGEIVGIGGLAGSGRSEVVRAIIGADPIASGEVWVRGKKVSLKSPADAMRAGIAMVPEQRKTLGIVAGFSVSRNITISAMEKVTSAGLLQSGREEAVARDFIKELRIKTRSAGELIENLSGGNQQKVLFARAVFAEPILIIVDEPTQGIDVGAKVEVYRLIREFVAKGGAAIVISSELPELLGLSDRIVVMREGTKAGELRVPPGGVNSSELMDQLQHHIMQLATGSSSER
ncbi:MAG: sugar ABC transporter ATP-binding protein [Terrimicrobiaceae bacterium]